MVKYKSLRNESTAVIETETGTHVNLLVDGTIKNTIAKSTLKRWWKEIVDEVKPVAPPVTTVKNIKVVNQGPKPLW